MIKVLFCKKMAVVRKRGTKKIVNKNMMMKVLFCKKMAVVRKRGTKNVISFDLDYFKF
jgi:hypothetical protein